MDWLNSFMEKMGSAFDGMTIENFDILPYFTFIIRILLPVLAIIVISRCVKSLFSEKQERETWGYLSLPNGAKISLNHWENVIGRAKSSDVYLEYPTISRSHAALIRDDKGNWEVFDLDSKGGVFLNGKQIDYAESIKTGDLLMLGGVEFVFVAKSREEEREQAASRTKPGRVVRPVTTLTFLTEFQVLLGIQLCISQGSEFNFTVPIAFLALIGIMWACYFIMRAMRRHGFEIETIAFFLCTLGFAVTASAAPGELYKQIFLLAISIFVFFALGWFLRDLDRAQKLRWPIAAFGILLLGINLIFAEVGFGAKNWISIAGISFQPSEFVKICFVFAGAATLERLFAKRNLLMFIAFSGACVGALALMNDFGTALIFFGTYLVISFLRSGNLATVFLSVAGAGFAGMLAISIKPHIASRFATWGHAWDAVYEGGFQQVRAMSASASGGMFGVGAGEGWLKNIFAADTDLVFAMVSEELGLIIAVLAVLSIIVLAIFTIRSSGAARSSFYVIGACAAVTILMLQTILNVFGSLDILPFTGVTLPFVSKGGSSLIACWGLLAFVKAIDTRQNASFAIRLPKKQRVDKREVGDAE